MEFSKLNIISQSPWSKTYPNIRTSELPPPLSFRTPLRPNSWTWDKNLHSFPPCDSQSPLLTDFSPTPLRKVV